MSPFVIKKMNSFQFVFNEHLDFDYNAFIPVRKLYKSNGPRNLFLIKLKLCHRIMEMIIKTMKIV